MTQLALIHAEVSEAIEELRKVDNDPKKFGEELADIIIRTANLAHVANINLDAAVEMKAEKNRGRPHKHGGKRF